MAFFDFGHNEHDWQRQNEELDRARTRREQQEMHDDLVEYQPRIALARCDGSGELEEVYVDVDCTNVYRCPGCCACDPELYPEVEMVAVMRESRKPMQTAREVANAAWPELTTKGGVA